MRKEPLGHICEDRSRCKGSMTWQVQGTYNLAGPDILGENLKRDGHLPLVKWPEVNGYRVREELGLLLVYKIEQHIYCHTCMLKFVKRFNMQAAIKIEYPMVLYYIDNAICMRLAEALTDWHWYNFLLQIGMIK
jgi:hypothetical protein